MESYIRNRNKLLIVTPKPLFLGSQIEISPYMSNKRLADFCKERGMIVTGFAPLGASSRPW